MSNHLIIRRWRNPRPTGTVYRADCSCGEHIAGPTVVSRDESVLEHLTDATPEVQHEHP